MRDVHPWIDLHVVEGGGVMNHANVGTGRIPVAILNPPMTMAARAGRPPFDHPLPNLRVGVANLTVNHLQFMVGRDVPLTGLRDWTARRHPLRVSVDRVGTVDRLVFELALEQIGLTPAALESWGGGLVPADATGMVRSTRSGSSWASRRLRSRRRTWPAPSSRSLFRRT